MMLTSVRVGLGTIEKDFRMADCNGDDYFCQEV